MNAMNDHSIKFIVWIDADAVILDLGMKIELIGEQYNDADFIASADIRMGYINSGFLIIRNTVWSRKFIENWWTNSDRSKVCDQDAFDLLYSKYIKEDKINNIPLTDSISTKVKILRMDALNSHPPAMTMQQPYNQVLHLMGEITEMRKLVFMTGFSNICDARTGGFLPLQLGLSREKLLLFANIVYSNETEKLYNKAHEAYDEDFEYQLELFDDLSKSSHHLVDIYVANGTASAIQEAWLLRRKIFDLVFSRTTTIKDLLSKKMLVRKVSSTIYLMFLKRSAEAGNDLFGASRDIEEKRAVANTVFSILDDMFYRVIDESKPVPLHMTALMHQNLGLLDFQLAHVGQVSSSLNETTFNQLLGNSREQLIKSQAIFDKYFDDSQDSSTSREHVISMQVLATVMCLQKDFSTGIMQWEKTIQKARSNLKGVLIGPPVDLLSVVLYNAAACLTEDKQFNRAYELTNECIRLKSHYDKTTENKDTFEMDRIITLKKFIEENISKNDDSKNVNDNNAGIKTLSSSYSDEWEECEVGEEGCEEFYIDDDNSDDKELEEIRARYAEQSKRYSNNPNSNNNNNNNEDNIVQEIKSIKEDIINLQRRLLKLENIVNLKKLSTFT